jgi:hypothetical protein
MTIQRRVALGLLAVLLPSIAAGSLIQALDAAELTARAERIVVAQGL